MFTSILNANLMYIAHLNTTKATAVFGHIHKHVFERLLKNNLKLQAFFIVNKDCKNFNCIK